MSTTLLNIFHNDELYEVYISGTIIRRIVRFAGSNQYCRDLQWDDLCEEVQRKIVTRVIEERET